MKQNRRRRHLRPRPTRCQINQQITHIRSAIQLFQIEWLAESQCPEPSYTRLRFLHDMIVQMKDDISSLEEAF